MKKERTAMEEIKAMENLVREIYEEAEYLNGWAKDDEKYNGMANLINHLIKVYENY